MLNWNKQQLKNAKDNVLKTARGTLSPAAWALEQVKSKDSDAINTAAEVTLEGYENYLREQFQRITCRLGTVVEKEENLNAFVALSDREVVDAFTANPIVDRDCFCIMLEGLEVGNYWMLDEAGDAPIGL